MLILSMFMLYGCAIHDSMAETEDNRIEDIYNSGYITIYVDTQTGVQYLTIGQRGVCVMIDKDGRPLIYDGATTETNELTMLKIEG